MVKEAVERLIQLIEKENIGFKEFEVLLSAEEKTIINVLKKKKRAMNVNEIRNSIIDDFIKLVKYYGSIKELEKKLEDLDKQMDKIPFLIGGQEIKTIKIKTVKNDIIEQKKKAIFQKLRDLKEKKPVMEFWEGEFEDVPELFVKVYNELKNKGIIKNGKILERDKRVVAELINKYGIAKIPSYKTIERVLSELEAGGFVISRPDSGGRGKKLYAINPKLLKIINQK